VATYSQQYIVSQPIQIDISTLDQNTLHSINSQSFNTLFQRAKKLSPTAQDLNSELKYMKRTLLLNGYPKWIIKNRKKKQHSRSPEFRSKIVLPYAADLGETLKRILERHRIQTFFKPVIKLSTILASGKDAVPARKRRGVVYEIPCGSCEHRYIGETKRSLSTRLRVSQGRFTKKYSQKPRENSSNKTCSPKWLCFQLGLCSCSAPCK